jgi:DNA-binding transcriptional LysR family regulator
MNIPQFDLNLLQAFDALIRDRNLSRAGLRLGVSQPSMSHSLARLRKLAGDQLFVRVPGGVEPTAYALQIAGGVKEGLELLRGTFDGVASFDPLKCERTFQLLTSDIGELIFLPRLITKFKNLAPKATLRVLQLPLEAYVSAFASGEADLALGFIPSLQTGFYQQRLFIDSYVCVAGKFHPRVGDVITLRQFAAESHVLIEPSGSRYNNLSLQSPTATFVERQLAAKGLRRHIALRVPHFLVVPEIVQQTDLLAVLPSYVIDYMPSNSKIKVLRLPIKPPKFEVKQFWHQRSHNDLGNKWLRSLVAELFIDSQLLRRSSDYKS